MCYLIRYPQVSANTGTLPPAEVPPKSEPEYRCPPDHPRGWVSVQTGLPGANTTPVWAEDQTPGRCHKLTTEIAVVRCLHIRSTNYSRAWCLWSMRSLHACAHIVLAKRVRACANVAPGPYIAVIAYSLPAGVGTLAVSTCHCHTVAFLYIFVTL